MLSDNHSDDVIDLRARINDLENEVTWLKDLTIYETTNALGEGLQARLDTTANQIVTAYVDGYMDALANRRSLYPYHILIYAIAQITIDLFRRRRRPSTGNERPLTHDGDIPF
jgi:phosphoglycerate-specific signal transduction histidine kinase